MVSTSSCQGEGRQERGNEVRAQVDTNCHSPSGSSWYQASQFPYNKSRFCSFYSVGVTVSLGLLPGTEIAVSFSLKHRMGSAFTKFVAQAVVKLLVCKEICTESGDVEVGQVQSRPSKHWWPGVTDSRQPRL